MRTIFKPYGSSTRIRPSLKAGREYVRIQLLCSAPKGSLAGIVREAMHTGIGETQIQFQDEEEEYFEVPDLGIEL